MTTTDTTTDPRVLAFQRWLKDHEGYEVSTDDISEGYDEDTYEAEGITFRVLTDEEADEATADYIRESLWAFNSSFLVSHFPDGLTEEDIDAIRGDRCEDANGAFVALVGDGFDDLVADAISQDGRGHFLSHYDHEEHDLVDATGKVAFYGFRVD